MKKLIIPLAILSLFLCSCSKKQASIGHIQFVNNSKDVYEAYIDDKPKGIIENYSTQTFDVSVGKHNIKAQILNYGGFISFTATPDVPADQPVVFMFPH